jgi:HTH-type transcriptional regulator / antitoxin HipB
MMAKNVRELGAVLREARANKGLTQRDIARKINVMQSVISKLEKGYPGASIGLIFQMLRSLDLPMNIGEVVPAHNADMSRPTRSISTPSPIPG